MPPDRKPPDRKPPDSALDRRLRTTVPEWNAVGLHVAEQSGFIRSATLALDGRQYITLEQP
jgi:hypothetical protein